MKTTGSGSKRTKGGRKKEVLSNCAPRAVLFLLPAVWQNKLARAVAIIGRKSSDAESSGIRTNKLFSVQPIKTRRFWVLALRNTNCHRKGTVFVGRFGLRRPTFPIRFRDCLVRFHSCSFAPGTSVPFQGSGSPGILLGGPKKRAAITCQERLLNDSRSRFLIGPETENRNPSRNSPARAPVPVFSSRAEFIHSCISSPSSQKVLALTPLASSLFF